MGSPLVRWGTPDDQADVEALLTEMHGEGRFPASLSPQRLSETVELLLGTSGVLLLEIEGEIAGSVGIQVVTPWFSEDRVLQEAWFYLLPQHRTFGNFKSLINRSKDISDEVGLPLLLQLHSEDEPERKLKLFGRSMKLIGGLFLHS